MHNLYITVNDTTYNLLEDWNCYVKTYEITPPTPKYRLVEVPYRNGSLDMSEAVSGAMRYGDRTIQFPVLINSSDPLATYNLIVGIVNGNVCKIRVSEEAERCYKGRVTVGKVEPKQNKWEFDLIMTASPFRIIDRKYMFSSPATVNVVNDGERVVPTITTDSDISIRLDGGDIYLLGAGTYQKLELAITQGTHVFDVTGDATVSIAYEDRVR